MSTHRFAHAGLVALALTTAAPAAHAARGQSVSLTTGLLSFYDSNFLDYSDGQITDFEQSFHPDRYAIETRDDMIFNPALSLSWELDQGKGRRHSLRLRGEGDFHNRNGNTDFRAVSAGWRESWSRDRRLAFSYFVLPRYYLRQLLDEDVVPTFSGQSRYRRADFRLDIASASWRQRLRRHVLVETGYQHERRDYNHDFDERDSGLNQGTAELSFVHLPHRATVGLGGGYRVSHARGEDGDEPEPTPDPDVSYHGAFGGLGGRMEFARRGPWRFGGDLRYTLETRSFDSDRPTDTYHFGRNDVLHAVEAGLRATYRPHWSLRGSYRFEDNSAHLGAGAPLSADAGSYNAGRVGVAIEWVGDLWHQASAEAEGDPEAQP